MKMPGVEDHILLSVAKRFGFFPLYPDPPSAEEVSSPTFFYLTSDSLRTFRQTPVQFTGSYAVGGISACRTQPSQFNESRTLHHLVG